jgi:predicted nucleotidyltransferase
MHAIKIPEKKIASFCQRYHVQRLALFGSVLRNDFSAASDVDVLVLFDPSARVGFLTLGKMKRELSEIFHRPVDLVPQDGLKSSIRASILSSAQEIYAA